jgi:hypothetical protein
MFVVSGAPGVESVTVAVKPNMPGVVGVPAMAPVEAVRVSPPGSAPTVIEYR